MNLYVFCVLPANDRNLGKHKVDNIGAYSMHRTNAKIKAALLSALCV